VNRNPHVHCHSHNWTRCGTDETKWREGSKERNSTCGATTIRRASGQRRMGTSRVFIIRFKIRDDVGSSRHEVTPADVCDSQNYRMDLLRALFKVLFCTCSLRFASCLLGADLISISRCSSPREFVRVVAFRCSFSAKGKEMTKSLHPLCPVP